MKAQTPGQGNLVWLLDRVIRSAEKHELASPSIEFGPIILTAVASAALRELHSGTRGMPKKVAWTAMSCRPHEASSWQATLLGEEPIPDREPVPFTIPEHVTKAVVGSTGQAVNEPEGSMLTLLPLPGNSNIEVLPPIISLYLRRTVMELPEPHGTIRAAWLLGTKERLTETEEGQADSTLMQAERIIGDRLLHGLGSYKPVTTVLASIDDGFRESLRSARAATGLVQFLEDLEESNSTFQNTDPEDLDPDEAPLDSASTQINFSPELLRNCVRATLEALYGNLDRDAQIKVATEGHLRTNHGDWHAFAEFDSGFMRSKTVLVEVCATRAETEQAISKYMALSLPSRDRDSVRLLIVLSGVEAALIDQRTANWQKATGVNFAILR